MAERARQPIAIFSDVHGNLEALTAVLAELDRDGVERRICLGDVCSYNAEQEACIELLVARGVEWIAGNHDLIAAGLLEPLSCTPFACHSAMRGRRALAPRWRDHIGRLPLTIAEPAFAAFHAGPERVDTILTRPERLVRAADAMRARALADIGFFGHTHLCRVYRVAAGAVERVDAEQARLAPGDGVWLVNVGTVGEPRGHDRRASYVLFDPLERTVAFRRVEYEFEVSRAKSLAGGWRRDDGERRGTLYDRLRSKGLRLRHRLFPRATDDSALDAIERRRPVGD